MREKWKSKAEIIKITTVILIFATLLGGMGKEVSKKSTKQSPFLLLIEQTIDERLKHSVMVLPAFLEKEDTAGGFSGMISEAVKKQLPLQVFLATADAALSDKEMARSTGENALPDKEMARSTEENALSAEEAALKEGSDEDYRTIEESSLDYDENALHIEDSMMKELQEENRRYAQQLGGTQENSGQADAQQENAPQLAGNGQQEGASVAEGAPITQEAAPAEGAGFVKAAIPAYSYDWSKEWGYDELVSNFYAIDSTTELKEEYVSLEKLLNRDLSIEKGSGEDDLPRILIYHTHSQEAFADSVPGDASTSIVGAGERLAQLLREEYGFSVLHHTGEYDVENRDYAYSNSLPAIEALLEQYPSIEVVIDLHRDAMEEGTKLLMDLQGRPTARIMFFNGMSYSKGNGEIDYLENPYIEENLAFSFQAQVAANEYYPGIARRIYLKAYRYNMHLRAKTLLVELGAQTNTVEEIRNACDPLAHIIAIVLSKDL